MNRYAQVVLLALVTVLASVSLRRATAAALGSTWQSSFSVSDGMLSSTQPQVPIGIGGAPMPPPKAQKRSLAIGGAPMPPPKVQKRSLAIGGAPMPPPKVQKGSLAIGG